MGDEQIKFCSRCKTEKGVSNFCKNKGTKDGLRSWCRSCSTEYIRERRKKIPKKIRYYRSKKYNLKQYGIGLDTYNKIFQKQQGCCAICGIHQSQLKRALSVEHNHLTGEVRGLTCIKCNMGLGGFRVDEKGVELLEVAINYLKGDRNEDA